MAEEKDDGSNWGVAFGLLVIFALGGLFGVWITEELYRRAAVEHGAAKWVPKDAHGNTKFEWVKPSVEY